MTRPSWSITAAVRQSITWPSSSYVRFDVERRRKLGEARRSANSSVTSRCSAVSLRGSLVLRGGSGLFQQHAAAIGSRLRAPGGRCPRSPRRPGARSGALRDSGSAAALPVGPSGSRRSRRHSRRLRCGRARRRRRERMGSGLCSTGSVRSGNGHQSKRVSTPCCRGFEQRFRRSSNSSRTAMSQWMPSSGCGRWLAAISHSLSRRRSTMAPSRPMASTAQLVPPERTAPASWWPNG